MSDGVLILTGATASGKSETAVRLARDFDAEIVGADSRQIYRDMPIGTAAPLPEQLAEVPHHLIGFLDPHERYSAARFAGDALAAIRDITGRGKRAIVAGGTGFYIRALCGGVSLAPQYDELLRARLAREALVHSPEFLYHWLQRRDSRRASSLHRADTYRVLRALEVALAKPSDVARAGELPTLAGEGIRWQLVFLDVPRDELDRRIAQRTDWMLAAGFVDEAERIGEAAVAGSAVGYPAALAYLRGRSTLDELRASLARSTRRYARRQRTWFRGEPATIWCAPGSLAAVVREKLQWRTN
ncbi:MAG TPA: tRNA (adenosine(37)-N6)-dimethylallyltransferase MiaA [Candidatus Cybelea sp.]